MADKVFWGKWEDPDPIPLDVLDGLFGPTVTIRVKGCYWPPTDEHLRECENCQQMAHIMRLELQAGAERN